MIVSEVVSSVMVEERFRIELWRSPSKLERVIARSDDWDYVQMLYSATVAKFPGQTVVLWDRAAIIQRSDW
jgi:hypothetical protein